ncbi:MAG TPA: cytochrome c biogenesis protein CcsA [Thermoanaerobaculia bacterium]|jgi:heme exporter protein C|nr:cytochrome c biogenesis protein CcsA [Thermoanaerobaculia bacterium]
MRHFWHWLLWLWIALAIAGAFLYAPLAKDFIGQSSRILFFHVPMAWGSFVAFMTAGVWSLLYLGKRQLDHDRAAQAAVEVGLLFCVLATVTGAMWARVMWGAWWNWDPRQTSIAFVLVFYAAYLVLRGAIEDPDLRARLAAAYAVFGLVVAPFLFFVLPRMATFTLHPDAVVNTRGKVDVDARMLQVLLVSALGFNVFFFWLHRLRWRLLRLEARRAAEGLTMMTEAQP